VRSEDGVVTLDLLLKSLENLDVKHTPARWCEMMMKGTRKEMMKKEWKKRGRNARKKEGKKEGRERMERRKN
jgi:hypothetical protein